MRNGWCTIGASLFFCIYATFGQSFRKPYKNNCVQRQTVCGAVSVTGSRRAMILKQYGDDIWPKLDLEEREE